MKTLGRAATATLGAVLFGMSFVTSASAECGYYRGSQAAPVSWHQQGAWQGRDQDSESDKDSIVGFWQFKFVSKDSSGIPDGTVVDAGYAQWHSDGTEITNSGGRSPLTGNFCLGVWKKTARSTYKLNHFALSWDPTGSSLIGPANIREDVTVSHDGKTFTGTFTIDQFDQSGNLLAHVGGVVSATRITVDSPVEKLF